MCGDSKLNMLQLPYFILLAVTAVVFLDRFLIVVPLDKGRVYQTF